MLLQFGGVQAIKDVREVQKTSGTPWIDVPGLAKDPNASVVVQRFWPASYSETVICCWVAGSKRSCSRLSRPSRDFVGSLRCPNQVESDHVLVLTLGVVAKCMLSLP